VNVEELYYKVPELNPIEQLEVDHPGEEHQLLLPGARVLALWGHEFYAALVTGYFHYHLPLIFCISFCFLL
jgi:hypothetical protein